MPLITLYKGTAGLNTKLDPESINSNAEESLIEFSQAVNISIDNRGLISLRGGNSLLNTGNYSSVFCDGGDCFVVQERVSDAAILRRLTDGSLVGVRSALTKGLRMAWGQVGEDTFYSNGTENGFIRAGVSEAWPINAYEGPEDDRQFMSAIPKANHIAFRQHGQILLAIGNAILANHSPFLYGLFSARSGFVAAFESDVTMLASVGGGFYASDGKRTWFFRQMEGWYNYRQEVVENASAITGALAIDSVKATEIGIEAPGFMRTWASGKGICRASDDGTVVNITEDKVAYPSGINAGACLVKDGTLIHTTY